MFRLFADLRFALRQFRKTPVFTVTVLAVLALGVGATTSIFTLFDQVLLRSLPVSHPEELVRVREQGGSFRGRISAHGSDIDDYLSYPAYTYLRDNTSRIFTGLIASWPENTVGVVWHDRSDLATAELVSGNYFQVLGVPAVAGRTLAPSDDRSKLGSPVAMLSYGYWQRQFGGNADVIGRGIQINGHPFTIVGVAPQRFHSVSAGETTDLFVPMMMKPAITPDWDDLDNYNSRWVNIVARLAPGVTMQQASAALQPTWHAERVRDFTYQQDQSASSRAGFIDRAHMELQAGATGFSPLREQLSTPIKVLMGMAVLVLLMACANVGSLLLVRAAARTREMSVRYALGAKREGILQQLLVEGLLLGLIGGGLGLLLAHPVTALLIRRIQGISPGDAPYSAAVDTRILLITIAITLATSLLFSLAPALQFWRPNLLPALKQQNTTVSGKALLVRRASVGLQIAISVLLLAGAGLFLRTVTNMRAEDLGFRADHLVSFSVDPRLAGYQTDQVYSLDQRIAQTLAALSGVQSVSATDDPELANNNERAGIKVDGYKPAAKTDNQVEYSTAMGGYLNTIGARLLAGRDLNDSDRQKTTPVGLMSRSAAVRYYGSVQNAIGRSFTIDDEPRTVVGVFDDIRHVDLRRSIDGRVIVPYLQQSPRGLTFILRTSANPDAMMNTVRQTMQQLDSRLALASLQTMDVQIDTVLVEERTLALLATSFGLLAALMSAVGLYGVLAYDTVQRTREIGVRMALGASRPAVARLLMLETLKLVGISIVLALPIAWALARLAGTVLFGVQAADPLTYGAVTLLVATVALVASAVPTWRAASVEPMRALRYE